MEMMDILLCFAAGLSAGVLNTLAGSGSIITLSLLSFLGLPAQIANGTNRIGLFFQGSVGSYQFFKQGDLSIKGKFNLILLTLIGTVLGVYTASQLNVRDFEYAVGGVFCLLFFVVLFKPQQYIKNSQRLTKLLPLIFGIIGFYAGFIQAGAGVFMLAFMHAVWGKSFTELNPLKVFLIFLINLFALAGYAYVGQVDWGVGLALAGGQIVGALVGVRLNNLKKNIEWAIRLLILTLIILSVSKFWKLF